MACRDFANSVKFARVLNFIAYAHVNTWSYITCKTIGIWPGMLPIYLQIGGCNACYRGISLVLVAWAVHDILGNPNCMRIAGTQIRDHGEKWMTSCGTHMDLHV